MKTKILLLVFLSLNLFSEDSVSLLKQKMELEELKKELNNFYNEKEKEYQDRKKELDTILARVEKEKNEIKSLHDKNLQILKDIKETGESKTTKIYNSMKPKDAADIFNQMISEGKIEDVFDIILRIKEKNVTLIMKSLSVQNAALLTQMLENYNVQSNKKD